MAILVEHRDIELDDVDARAESRGLRFAGALPAARRQQCTAIASAAIPEHRYTTPAFFITAIVVSSASFAPSSGDISGGTRPSGSGLTPPS